MKAATRPPTGWAMAATSRLRTPGLRAARNDVDGSCSAAITPLLGGRLLASLIIAIAASLPGCAPPVQLGSPADAAEATNDFLRAMTSGGGSDAWEHLTPTTRDALFDGNKEAFAREVDDADWSAFEWQIGPVTDYEVSWGVHVEVDPEAVPDFLIESGLASEYQGRGLVLLVQFAKPGWYVVAGQGLDTDLR